MVTSGGERQHDLPRVPPSKTSRTRSRTPNIFKRHPWIIAVVLTATVEVAARRTGAFGAAATSETGQTPHNDESSIIAPGAMAMGLPADRHDGGTTRLSCDDGDGRHLFGFGLTDQCVMSPLWRNKVDPANYEFGCEEIEVGAEKTFEHCASI